MSTQARVTLFANPTVGELSRRAPGLALLVFLRPGPSRWKRGGRSAADDRIVTNGRRTAIRFARLSRILLCVVPLASIPGKVLAGDRVLDLAIHDGRSGAERPPVFSVLQNDRVVIRLTSDEPLHVHLHGYDIESDVAPNHATSLRCTATATGRFPLEIHSSQARKQAPLAYVEVRPR
jgi:hypothetical protein